jgi:hypothetical protein
MILIIVALILLAAEVAYDSYTTKYLLGLGGTEANPIAAFLQKHFGVYGAGAAGFLVAASTLLINDWIIWIILLAEGVNCYFQYQKYTAAKKGS